MHSSILRGTDFEMMVDGHLQTHADYFRGFTKTKRLGLVAPNRVDGAGAVNLIMAYVTAFYDDYRADRGEFYAYPDFFAFQPVSSLANYAMYDISPRHKLVPVGPEPIDKLNAINDRAVNVLLVPDGEPAGHQFERVALVSAKRNLEQCYVYSFEGHVDDADVTIHCNPSRMVNWVQHVFDSLKDDAEVQQLKRSWLAQTGRDDQLVQSFRRVSLEKALSLL